jgi:hypothetical protein
MLTVLFIAIAVLLGLILVRLLPLLLAILVAAWLLHHPAWLIGIVVAAVFLSIVRAIGTGQMRSKRSSNQYHNQRSHGLV